MDNYFYQSIADDKLLCEIFKSGIENGSIQNFDATVISRLRRIYFSSISAILYILGEKDIPSTHGNKMELLAYVLNDEDYTIVHGQTRSSLKSDMKDTSWIEVKKNNKVWVYDIASMLKFEHSYFERLESPNETKRIPKEMVLSHPEHRETNYSFEYIPMIIVWFVSRYENATDNPFYLSLRAEIKRYKRDINYTRAAKDYYEETAMLSKSPRE